MGTFNLAEVIQYEGQKDATVEGLEERFGVDNPACIPARAVISIYKPAAGLRKKEGALNVGVESVDMFNFFIYEMIEASQDGGLPMVVRALCLHDAASGCANGNANRPEDQKLFNEQALGMLDGVSASDRDDPDWQVVWAKVYSGLVEGGHKAWKEEMFRIVVAIMLALKWKDYAGRAKFLAEKLAEAGRFSEAVEVLTPVEGVAHPGTDEKKDGDTWSAPNQKEGALKLLGELRTKLVSTHDEV